MATKKTGGSGKTLSLEPKVVAKLLGLLSTDNEFRRLFKKDPVAALTKAGYKGSALDKASLACMSVTNIATKQEIAASLEEIKSYLTSQGAHMIPHCFEAGKIASTLKRK